MIIDKPMLAPNDEFNPDTCALPKLASAKIDGFRMFNQNGIALTRSGKPMANKATQELFSNPIFDGLDGELVVGAPNDPNVFNNSQGPLRRIEGDPGAVWYVFDDRTDPSLPFNERLTNAIFRVARLEKALGPEYKGRLRAVAHDFCKSLEEVDAFEIKSIAEGFEGIMLRDPAAPYKFGRATYKANTFLKVKRLSHDEAVIVRLEEQMINDNEAFADELGRTKRQSLKENLRPSGMVGAFWMKSQKWPEEFKVSASSLTHADKKHAWDHPEEYVNEIGAFKYFGHGTLNAPRQGVFKGLRSNLDMS